MRASRLLAILILLQNRGRLTADYLAREFEVSIRTIYRDIDALSAAGVPVYGDRGPGGGFALLDGWRTRLTGLADNEAAALALSGVPSAAEAAGLGAALRDAFGKLLAALPGEGPRRAGEAVARFHIDPADWYRGTEPSPWLPEIVRAVLDGRRLALTYSSWESERDWKLDPLGLVLKAGAWYLVGQDVPRRRIGIYRVGAIRLLTVLDMACDRPAGFDLASWWKDAQSAFEAQLFATPASLRATATGLARLCALSPRGRQAAAQARPCQDGWALVSMSVEDSDHGARELLSAGPEIEVLAPASLRARIHRLAKAAASLHQGDK